jgi:K+-sensing histidine kinase KdpD
LTGPLASPNAARGPLDPADVTLIEEITDRIAMAIDRVDLYQNAVSMARAREELLATVSHELRSPLSSIVFSAAILEKDASAAPPNQARHLERIRRTAESHHTDEPGERWSRSR